VPSSELSDTAVREIVETPVTGLKGRTPRAQIIEEKPNNNGREKEPVFIIDKSRSNLEWADPEMTITKADLLKVAVPLAAGKLAGDDSQAKNEVGTDKGGVRSYGFNEPGEFTGWNQEEAEFEDERDYGDLHEGNVQEALSDDSWDGRTYPMPAIRAAEKAFQAEFGDRPMRNRPTMEVVYWGDGQISTPEEEQEFENWVAQADEFCVVAIVLVGYGPGHDKAVNAFQKIAAKNKFVSVVALTGVSDPTEAALDVQLMAA
jgi:hypothetical protein